MFDSRVEAIEVRVDEASAVTSKTLSEDSSLISTQTMF